MRLVDYSRPLQQRPVPCTESNHVGERHWLELGAFIGLALKSHIV